ncbi:uncharacterized protein A4U43_C03F20640 [Asparagus officinalis]|uniref:Uncharacterized protein n=1 Tax=Asparagus officinalis TaxID=4686 RepID=A0A5P1FBP3_ASPOF|nr:uncharacterized protein A4U43_C03F20640 [Asparagus officinalis]
MTRTPTAVPTPTQRPQRPVRHDANPISGSDPDPNPSDHSATTRESLESVSSSTKIFLINARRPVLRAARGILRVGVLLGLSNTAGVLAGVFRTAATCYILQHGSWDDVFKVSIDLYRWNLEL